MCQMVVSRPFNSPTVTSKQFCRHSTNLFSGIAAKYFKHSKTIEQNSEK